VFAGEIFFISIVNLNLMELEILFALSMLNVTLMFVLIYFIHRNRTLMSSLGKNINQYMEKDINNLKKVIDSTMHNDDVINSKTDFILDVLDEDNDSSDLIPSIVDSTSPEFNRMMSASANKD
jgi:hypothetical protein